jgi:hypothetical protein
MWLKECKDGKAWLDSEDGQNWEAEKRRRKEERRAQQEQLEKEERHKKTNRIIIWIILIPFWV